MEEKDKLNNEVKENAVVEPEVIDSDNNNVEDDRPIETGEEVFQEDPNDRKKMPIVPLIIMGVIIVLMIVCVIVILTTGGPYNGPSSSGSNM